MAEGISRIGIISLVSAADTAAPLAPPGLGLRREPSGVLAGGGSNAGQEGKGRTGLTAVDLQLAAPPFAAPLARWAEGNQKLLLLAAFLKVGGAAVLLFEGPPESGAPALLLQAPTARTAFSPPPCSSLPQIGSWEHAQQLMRWLRALGVSDFALFPPVGRALCECGWVAGGWESTPAMPPEPAAVPCTPPTEPCVPSFPPAGGLIGRELQPIYATYYGGVGAGAAALQLTPRLLELLAAAGQHLYHSVAGGWLLLGCCRFMQGARAAAHPALCLLPTPPQSSPSWCACWQRCWASTAACTPPAARCMSRRWSC